MSAKIDLTASPSSISLPPSDDASVADWCEVHSPAMRAFKKKKVTLSPVSLFDGGRKFVDNEWVGIEETHRSIFVEKQHEPIPYNIFFYRKLRITANVVYDTYHINKGQCPFLNPFDFFSVDHENARECEQVITKVCAWCGRNPCNFFKYEQVILDAITENGGSYNVVKVPQHAKAKRAAFKAYNEAVIPLEVRANRDKPTPFPFCVEGHIKMYWPTI